MKILMLTPYLPFPPSSGGQIRSYNLLKQLSKKHDITLFCYIRRDSERKFIPELQKYCKKIRVFERRQAWNPLNVILAGLTAYPFLVCIYLSRQFRLAVAKELSKNKYDLIHAETFYVMTNIPKTKIPILLVEQTIEYLVYKHYVESLKNLTLRWLLSIDVGKLRFWETAFWKKADGVVAVSNPDKAQMLRLASDLEVGLVPNGVNLDFFKVKKSWDDKNPRILFVANFKWLQNVEAAEILLGKVFPKISEKLPGSLLWIVGQHIPEKIIAQKSGRIIVDSLKEDDEEGIRNAYFHSSLFVSPLRGPGGTRLKHFAAMASNLPLITTKVGAEGLSVKDGDEVIIRDDPNDIASEAVGLLENSKRMQLMSQKARMLVSQKFSWEVVARKLDELYEKTRAVNNNS